MPGAGHSFKVKKLNRQHDATLAISNGVMQSLQHCRSATGETFDGDKLPKRPLSVEGLPAECCH